MRLRSIGRICRLIPEGSMRPTIRQATDTAYLLPVIASRPNAQYTFWSIARALTRFTEWRRFTAITEGARTATLASTALLDNGFMKSDGNRLRAGRQYADALHCSASYNYLRFFSSLSARSSLCRYYLRNDSRVLPLFARARIISSMLILLHATSEAGRPFSVLLQYTFTSMPISADELSRESWALSLSMLFIFRVYDDQDNL